MYWIHYLEEIGLRLKLIQNIHFYSRDRSRQSESYFPPIVYRQQNERRMRSL